MATPTRIPIETETRRVMTPKVTEKLEITTTDLPKSTATEDSTTIRKVTKEDEATTIISGQTTDFTMETFTEITTDEYDDDITTIEVGITDQSNKMTTFTQKDITDKLGQSTTTAKPIKMSMMTSTKKPSRVTCNLNCPLILDIVCGTDGVTYQTTCVLEAEACKKNDPTLVVAHSGPCVGRGPFTLNRDDNDRYVTVKLS